MRCNIVQNSDDGYACPCLVWENGWICLSEYWKPRLRATNRKCKFRTLGSSFCSLTGVKWSRTFRNRITGVINELEHDHVFWVTLTLSHSSPSGTLPPRRWSPGTGRLLDACTTPWLEGRAMSKGLWPPEKKTLFQNYSFLYLESTCGRRPQTWFRNLINPSSFWPKKTHDSMSSIILATPINMEKKGATSKCFKQPAGILPSPTYLEYVCYHLLCQKTSGDRVIAIEVEPSACSLPARLVILWRRFSRKSN